ncbi:MAG: NapC/NirT family cytochrome c [Gemmobacter sp.]|nr:NapC/NirT family cytochrome c [Gemmobacter sp.]
MTEETPKTGRLWRRWVWFGVPTAGAAAAFAAGIIFWGGFNTAMEATNTMGFCISCHEMRENVFKEYEHTIHHENRSGVQATCSDCHVPDPWIHKMIRKVKASRELYGKVVGTIDTPEKFEEHRLRLATNVWTAMKETDSRECRNCHTIESMNPRFQKPRARTQHLTAMETGQTCIDCHKGIAHSNVRDKASDELLEVLEAPNPAHIKAVPQSFLDGLAYVSRIEAEAAQKAAAEAQSAETALNTRIAEAVEKAKAEALAQVAAAATTGPAAEAIPTLASAPNPGGGTVGSIAWDAVPAVQIGLFYPGQASWEWVLNGKEHGGARPFTKGGEQCSTCHAKETAAMGAKIVSGEKAESTPTPGKRGSVDVQVQAARDADTLYLRLRWQNGTHTPVPFVEGGKMDPENPVKLAMMVTGEGIDRGQQAGCWASCHIDSRYMPNAPDSLGDLSARLGGHDFVQKYLPESRTDLDLKGKDRPMGGWDLLRAEDELAAYLGEGKFMDLTRVDAAGNSQRGYLLERRHEDAGSPVQASAVLEGDMWTVVIARPLAANGPGQIAIEPGKTYTVGFALHDDHTAARFHHVSLDLRLALDDPAADLNVTAP